MPDADDIREGDADYNRLVNRLLASQNNTVQAVEGGFKVPGVDTVFPTFGDALRFRKNIGMSSWSQFTNTMGYAEMPGQGAWFYPFLEAFGRSLGPDEAVWRESRHIDRSRD